MDIINQSLVLRDNGILSLEYSPMPVPNPDEVVVKIAACGICSSDIPRAFNYGAYNYPLVMGHEFAGQIVKIGAEVNSSLIGKNVTVFPLLPCFLCAPCQRKAYGQCTHYKYYGSRNNGGYTKYIAVKEWNVLPLPNGVTPLDGALTEPAAVVLHGLSRLGLIKDQEGKRLLILGAGFLGILSVEILNKICPDIKITIADRNQYKLDLIAHRVTETVLLEQNEELERFSAENDSAFDFVIEVTGAPPVFRESIRLACPGGSVLWMGNAVSDVLIPMKLVSKILRKEITILGTWNSTFSGCATSDWTKILELMASGFKPSRYVSNFVQMKDAPSTLFNLNEHKSAAKKNKIFKALILPQDE
jgi:L-iditol 2-dehydrogenase